MPRFRDRSIRTKIVLLAVGSVLVALSLCSLGFMALDVQMMRAAKVRELQASANTLGFNSSAVVSFGDAPAARQLLEGLRLQPTITCGCLYDVSGKTLASYSRASEGLASLPKTAGEARRRSRGRSLELFHPIVADGGGELLGTLYLRSSMSDFRAQLQYYLIVAGVVMVWALAASVLFAMKLQGSIAAPILRLSAIATKVSADSDYSVRAEYDGQDEIGGLCRAFDYMLEQVQSSEAALRGAQDELENRVLERTAQLESEIERRQRVQVDLERAKEAAEAANRAKSQFLANMSHEIRTPLNAILGFTDLLRRGADGGDEDERRDYLETIRTSGEHLLTLINDILDLSRIEANRMDVECVPCSPYEIIAEMVSVLRVRAQEKGLSLDLRWVGPMPATIQTDSFRLRQLLVNLLGNAVKFTAQGNVTVTARLLSEQAEPQLEIAVADTGVGISEDKLDDIFNPFVQADNSVTREFGGTGLGLAISRRIVDALGGTIRVESQPGKGSIFTFTLNTGSLDGVELLEPGAADALAGTRRSGRERPVVLPPARILLVEDGSINRKLIGLILRRAGAQVITAENGQVAVELAGQHAFDMVLMDMQMPVMDGYTATTRLRQQGIETPVIALTAHAMKGDVEKCRAAGCSGYLSKPVSAEALLRAVSEALAAAPQKPPGPRPLPADRIVSSLNTSDPDFRQIVQEYVAELQAQIESMKRSFDARDRAELTRVAHRIKGSAGTAGFDMFTAPARRLEQLVRNDQWDQAGPLLEQMAAMAQRIALPEAADA